MLTTNDAHADKKRRVDPPAPVPLDQLVEWVTQGGALFPKLDFCYISEYGYGAVAREDIQRGEEVFSIPLAYLITKQTELAHPVIGSVLQQLETSGSVESNYVTFIYIIYMRFIHSINEPHAAFSPYFLALPSTVDTPLFYCEDDVTLLSGSNMINAITSVTATLVDVANTLFPVLSQRYPTLFPASIYTLENLKWAYAIHWSRCLSVHDDQGSAVAAHVPLGDMLNHKMRVNIEWISDVTRRVESRVHAPSGYEVPYVVGSLCADRGVFILKLNEDVTKGEQVFNNYGGKGNGEFLFSYGFTIENNSEDVTYVKIGLAAGDELKDDKSMVLTRLGLDLGYYLRLDSVKPEFLQSCRICLMNRQELYFFNSQTLSKNHNNVISLRNELCTLRTLVCLLWSRVLAFGPGGSAKECARLGEASLSRRERDIYRYRMGQQQILENLLRLCEHKVKLVTEWLVYCSDTLTWQMEGEGCVALQQSKTICDAFAVGVWDDYCSWLRALPGVAIHPLFRVYLGISDDRNLTLSTTSCSITPTTETTLFRIPVSACLTVDALLQESSFKHIASLYLQHQFDGIVIIRIYILFVYYKKILNSPWNQFISALPPSCWFSHRQWLTRVLGADDDLVATMTDEVQQLKHQWTRIVALRNSKHVTKNRIYKSLETAFNDDSILFSSYLWSCSVCDGRIVVAATETGGDCVLPLALMPPRHPLGVVFPHVTPSSCAVTSSMLEFTVFSNLTPDGCPRVGSLSLNSGIAENVELFYKGNVVMNNVCDVVEIDVNADDGIPHYIRSPLVTATNAILTSLVTEESTGSLSPPPASPPSVIHIEALAASLHGKTSTETLTDYDTKIQQMKKSIHSSLSSLITSEYVFDSETAISSALSGDEVSVFDKAFYRAVRIYHQTRQRIINDCLNAMNEN